MKNSSSSAKMWTPANVVTTARIVGVPVFVVVMAAPWEQLFANPASVLALKPWVSTVVFLILSFSDFLDGYLARSRNEVTNYGKFMDPLADKLLVIAAFLVMVQTGLLPAWVPLIVLFREFLVSGLRMMAASKGQVIAASWYGKAKTVTQMIAIVLLMLIDALPAVLGAWAAAPVHLAAWVMLGVSLVLTILSMIDYFVKSKSIFQEEPDADAAQPPALREEPETSKALSLSADTVDLPEVTETQICQLAQDTLSRARGKHLTLGTAESLTGGMICAALTAVPGSSDVVLGGVASYAYSVKSGILKVDSSMLAHDGAVNSETATQMAQGARHALNCDIAVAVTGIAGPGGEEPGKPVGTVWTAVSSQNGTLPRRFVFTGSRATVRLKTVAAALLLYQEQISQV